MPPDNSRARALQMLSSVVAADEARRRAALNGTDRMTAGSGPYEVSAQPQTQPAAYEAAIRALYSRGPGASVPQYADGGIIKKGLGALRAYHGSPNEFDKFRTVNKSVNSTTFGDVDTTRHGAFFSDNPDFSAEYGKVKPFDLKVKNISDMSDKHEFVDSIDAFGPDRELWSRAKNSKNPWGMFEGELGERYVNWLKSRGHDAARFSEEIPTKSGGYIEGNTTVVFDPDLIAAVGKAAGGPIKRGAGALSSFFAKGKPETVRIPGVGEVPAAEIPAIQDAARSYMKARGLGSHRVDEYPKHSPEFGREIARAFDEMPHAPGDPAVKRSYEALMDETLDQYKALKGSGIDFKFLKDGQADPYAASPSLGYHDIQKNGRLWVFPTDQGYGTQADIADNPLLKRVGKVGDLPNATANDAFRVVHDAYGHFGPGNPFFRAPGEDRAWLNHSRMFSEDAKPAMTSETRGQNSWVNFGPRAEANKAASGADTVYADQKAGIMPPWTRAQSPLQAADMMRSEDRDRAVNFLKAIEGKGYAEGGRAETDWRPDPLAAAPFGERYVEPPAALGGEAFDKSRRAYRDLKPGEATIGPSSYDFGSAPLMEQGLRAMGAPPAYSSQLARKVGPIADTAKMAAVEGADMMVPQTAADVAMTVALGPVGKAARRAAGVTWGALEGMSPDDAQASFIGRNSLNWAKGRGERALDMLNNGASKDEVWRATQTMRDPFTHVLKQEINDRAAAFKPGAIQGLKSGKTLMVPDVIDHPQWTDGYLSYLSKIPVAHDKRLGDARGSFDGRNIAVDINQPEHMLMDTLLHEGQHAIQKREGWLGGSNLANHTKYGDLEIELSRYNIVDDLKNWARENGRNLYSMDTMADYRATLSPDMIDRTYGLGPLLSKPDDVLDAARLKALQEMGPVKSKYDAYRRHPGENEAHNVGSRLGLLPAESRKIPPWETQYVQDGYFTRNPGESFQNDLRHIVEREKRQAQK